MARDGRQRLIIDPMSQTAILWRLFIYWLFCLGTIYVGLLWWQILSTPGMPLTRYLATVWTEYGRVFIVGILVIPFLAADVIRHTNRLAGPVHRLRQATKRLASGQSIVPIRLRKDDFWHEFAEDFNRLAMRYDRLINDIDGPNSDRSGKRSAE